MKRIVVLSLLFLTSAGFAQVPGRIQTPTRFVTIFTNLENQLMDKLAANQREAAAKLLTDDFSQWASQPAGVPTPKDEWLKVDRSDMANFRVRYLSAIDLTDHVAVNFVWTDGKKAFFVVDIWKKAATDWLLASRYLAPVDATPYRGPARPTGKD